MSHLAKRISALVDGELGHEARDRALVHVAHCAPCREQLSAERMLKERLSTAATPRPPARLLHNLLAIDGATPGGESHEHPRTHLPPLLPALPHRSPSTWGRRPRGRSDSRRPRSELARRTRVAAAGVLAAGVVVFGAAFAAGGTAAPAGAPVVPPVAELSIEHATTTSGLPLRDAAFDAVTASVGGLTFPTSPPTGPAR